MEIKSRDPLYISESDVALNRHSIAPPKIERSLHEALQILPNYPLHDTINRLMS